MCSREKEKKKKKNLAFLGSVSTHQVRKGVRKCQWFVCLERVGNGWNWLILELFFILIY
jgi:hypothetical protein